MTSSPKPISRKVKIVASLFMVGVFLLLGIIVAELICRKIPEYARPGYEYDGNLLFRLKRDRLIEKPYAMGKIPEREPFPLQINEYGFRADAFQPAKEKEKIRVLIVGDSYTAGLDYPGKEIFTNQVQEKLESNGMEVEILNASCPAWAYDQYYIYWITEGYVFQPDYLLLMSSPNDIREAYNKHIMHLNTDGELIQNGVRYPTKKRLGWKLANKSSLYQYLQKEVFETDYGNFFQIFHTYPVNFGKEDAENWDLPIYLKEPFPEVKESYELAEALLRQLDKACKENGTKLLLSTIPTTTDFNGQLDTTRYQPGLPAAFMKSVAEEAGIPYLDLYGKLAATKDPMQIFMSWEFHFNKKGHDFAAREISDWLGVQLRASNK